MIGVLRYSSDLIYTLATFTVQFRLIENDDITTQAENISNVVMEVAPTILATAQVNAFRMASTKIECSNTLLIGIQYCTVNVGQGL